MGEAAALESFVDPVVLDSLESVARTLMTPGMGLDEMERRLAVGERKRWTPVRLPAQESATPPPPDRATAHLEGRGPGHTPRSGRALRDMLGATLDQLASLEVEPLAEPAPVDDDSIVPVESLVYRGPAALDRARALRDVMRRTGVADPDSLNELYELLDLARAE